MPHLLPSTPPAGELIPGTELRLPPLEKKPAKKKEEYGLGPTLANIEKLCRALDVPPGDLLELIDDRPNAKRKRAPTRG